MYTYVYMYVYEYMNPSMYILYCTWSKADLTYAAIAYLHVLCIYMRTDCRVYSYCLTH